VSAFQQHFRPAKFDGVADGETLARLMALNEMLDRIV
jgi:N-acetyl-anhydromuramyl-L-alanine amidase AmpD